MNISDIFLFSFSNVKCFTFFEKRLKIRMRQSEAVNRKENRQYNDELKERDKKDKQ